MKELKLKRETCDELMRFFNYHKSAGNVRVLDNGDSLFNCLEIKSMKLKQMIEEELGMSFLLLRIHEFTEYHFAKNHTDTDYRYYSTAVINIHNKEKKVRFSAGIPGNGSYPLWAELWGKGEGLLMPPNTYHEVTTGDYLRYTLCGWTLNPGVE